MQNLTSMLAGMIYQNTQTVFFKLKPLYPPVGGIWDV